MTVELFLSLSNNGGTAAVPGRGGGAGGALPTWKGKFLNRAGRLKLLNASLSTIPYLLTMFAPKKWLLKRLNKIRRGFLWKGSEDTHGGHCLVAWEKVQRPKSVGGLGVLDLEAFSRALRLRWLWYQWKERDRPWVGSDVPCNEVDNQLFRASTIVTLGNGNTAKFWDSAWLNGQAPRDIAPNLFKLAWRKQQTVAEDLQNDNWMRGLWRMNSAEELAEYVALWSLVQDIRLLQQEDVIVWRWTANGCYSAKSAYEVQFEGSYCSFNCKAIWKTRAEGKHRVFAWLLIQQRVLTADRLLARNWPWSPTCPLCDQLPETAEHLCLHCVFARELWFRLRDWTNGLVSIPQDGVSLELWWNTAFECGNLGT